MKTKLIELVAELRNLNKKKLLNFTFESEMVYDNLYVYTTRYKEDLRYFLWMNELIRWILMNYQIYISININPDNSEDLNLTMTNALIETLQTIKQKYEK